MTTIRHNFWRLLAVLLALLGAAALLPFARRVMDSEGAYLGTIIVCGNIAIISLICAGCWLRGRGRE
jgi:hypothetical protein